MNPLFPIVATEENSIIAIDGHVSQFYRISSPDLEQKDDVEKRIFREGVEGALNSLPDSSYYKFFRLEGKSYLQTDTELPRFPEVTFSPQEEPLNLMFGDNSIYSDVGIYENYLVYNEKFVRILSVQDFGEREINESYLPDGVDYVLAIKPLSKEKAISRLERIRTGHLGSFWKKKRDVEGEGTYAQAEELLEEIVHGRESLFEVELFFLVSGLSLEKLDKNTRSLTTEMLSKGTKLYLEGQSIKQLKSGLGEFFSELIPGVKPKLRFRTHLDKTSHLTFLLPFGESKLMDSGVEFFDIKGNPLYFNPFSYETKNRNIVVTGASGSGKSVFVNKLVHNLIDNHPTVIIDKGGSFKRLALYHGGTVLSKGFNPMQFADPLYLKELILSVVDTKKFDPADRGRLLRNIKEAIAEGIQDFNKLIKFLEEDFPEISFYFEETRDFFTKSSLPTNSLLYVDIESYPKSFVAPLIIFLLEYFKNIKHSGKILVFDECWSFLKDHADYIDECFRTFRKTGAVPIAVSQSLKDFSETECQITNNSYFKFFFPQEITPSCELSKFDTDNINTLLYEKDVFSECYLKTPDNKFRKTLRVTLSPLEWELFQSNSGEDKLLKFIDENGRHFSSCKETIKSYVRLKYD